MLWIVASQPSVYRRRMKHLGWCVFLCVVGCKDSRDAPATKSVEPAAAAAAPAAPKIDSLVPAALAGKLTFEKRELRDQFAWTFSVQAPTGWSQQEGFASLKPADEDNFGSKMYLSHDCAGACSDKDWAAVTNDEEFADLAKEQVAQDEKTATSRLMVTSANDITTVKYAWWAAGSTGYWTCTALLKKPYPEAAGAFAKACQTATATKGS